MVTKKTEDEQHQRRKAGFTQHYNWQIKIEY